MFIDIESTIHAPNLQLLQKLTDTYCIIKDYRVEPINNVVELEVILTTPQEVKDWKEIKSKLYAAGCGIITAVQQ
ncbi:hypothetical protein M0R04_14975 [Candidatus Dojkabacteria bacterium]|jgi:hypothetical protein|nr:hypothetical protein [Candidatus Dojkabacteria bacterium]